MNRLFGAKKVEVKPQPVVQKKVQEVVQPVRPKVPLSEQQARLQNKVRELSQTVTKLDIQARELLVKSKSSKGSAKQMYKQRCVMVLKKRKQYQIQLKNYMSQQFTLDQVAFTSDNIQNTIQMSETMKQVLQEQKNIMGQIDIDKLDQIRDQMDDMKYQTQYMNQMLNRDYQIDLDQDDLDDQFGQLEKEVKKEKLQQQKQSAQNNQQVAN